MHRKGLANSSDLVPKSPNDQKLDMSPLCSKQSTYTLMSMWTVNFVFAIMCLIINTKEVDLDVRLFCIISYFDDLRNFVCQAGCRHRVTTVNTVVQYADVGLEELQSPTTEVEPPTDQGHDNVDSGNHTLLHTFPFHNCHRLYSCTVT